MQGHGADTEGNGMQLDERKYIILQAIIRNYLETGEPVGSRTISKYTDLNLSSATIRNEMADLEELGYILQPHTSAGRIPSDKGYRLYVDKMMEDKGMVLSGQSPDGRIIEMLELPGHPFFIATQGHPELKSRPNRAHPLFRGLVQAAAGEQQMKGEKKL